MFAQLDIHDAGPNLVDAFIENVPFETEMGIGIEQLIYGLYVMCFQPLYSFTAPLTLKYDGWPLRRWPMGTIKDP